MAGNVWCANCKRYPEWNKQPGSGMCIRVTNDGRTIDSQPCEPKVTTYARLAKLFGGKIG